MSPLVLALFGIAIASLAVAALPQAIVPNRMLATVLGEWHGRLTILGAAALGAVLVPILLGWT